MDNIIQRLKDAYSENPAKALELLPELFHQYQEGKIVELPCALGTTVYFPVDKGTKYEMVMCKSFELSDVKSLNKTVFLTREAAEKALRECEK